MTATTVRWPCSRATGGIADWNYRRRRGNDAVIEVAGGGVDGARIDSGLDATRRREIAEMVRCLSCAVVPLQRLHAGGEDAGGGGGTIGRDDEGTMTTMMTGCR